MQIVHTYSDRNLVDPRAVCPSERVQNGLLPTYDNVRLISFGGREEREYP
jgi:hypothetical protein